MQPTYEAKLTCLKNNKAIRMCGSDSCNECSLMCHDLECECQLSKHVRCPSFKIQPVLQDLEQKSISPDQLKSLQLIEEIFSEQIEQLAKYRQKTRMKKKTLKLKESSSKLVNMISQNHLGEITGQLVFKTIKQLKAPEQNSSIKNSSQILNIWKEKRKQLFSFFEMISLLSEPIRLSSQDQQNERNFNLQQINRKRININGQKNVKQIEEESNLNNKSEIKSTIITNINDFIHFFGRKLISMRLLYRASQQLFSIQKFHLKCDNIPNTIVIIKTQFNKIIGGFTPLTWNSSIDNFTTDKQNKTFLFSYTNRQKYTLLKSDNYDHSKFAIYCSGSYGPTFGKGHDLYISKDAHVEKQSFCHFPTSFNNAIYTRQQYSFTAISGNQDGYKFTIKQWEVYEGTFDTK